MFVTHNPHLCNRVWCSLLSLSCNSNLACVYVFRVRVWGVHCHGCSFPPASPLLFSSSFLFLRSRHCTGDRFLPSFAHGAWLRTVALPTGDRNCIRRDNGGCGRRTDASGYPHATVKLLSAARAWRFGNFLGDTCFGEHLWRRCRGAPYRFSWKLFSFRPLRWSLPLPGIAHS